MLILIAGKQASLRNALIRFLQGRSGLEAVETSANNAELLKRVEAVSPDLLLLDEALVVDLKKEIIIPLQQLDLPPSVLILGSRSESEQEYLDAGAAAFVSKGAPPKSLLTAIEEIRLRGSSA